MNRFIRTIREKVKYPNKDGEYGDWDCLNFEQRKFLVECADYMEALEKRIERTHKKPRAEAQSCSECEHIEGNRCKLFDNAKIADASDKNCGIENEL